MKSIYRLTSIHILFCLMLGCSAISPQSSSTSSLDSDAVASAGLRNLKNPEANLFSSGQPSKEQLEILSEAGVQHVVSLRTEGEIDWDEKSYVESLGMSYHSLPVSGATGINENNASSLRNLIDSIDEESAVLHCGSGNRVGALMALDAAATNGGDLEQAVETGKSWGLTGLEDTVRSELSE